MPVRRLRSEGSQFQASLGKNCIRLSQQKKLSVVVTPAIPATAWTINKIKVQFILDKKWDPISKITRPKRAQTVQHLPTKFKDLSSNYSPDKTKKRKIFKTQRKITKEKITNRVKFKLSVLLVLKCNASLQLTGICALGSRWTTGLVSSPPYTAQSQQPPDPCSSCSWKQPGLFSRGLIQGAESLS
jgi:hypothetical protein